jgi:hypothetical protein
MKGVFTILALFCSCSAYANNFSGLSVDLLATEDSTFKALNPDLVAGLKAKIMVGPDLDIPYDRTFFVTTTSDDVKSFFNDKSHMNTTVCVVATEGNPGYLVATQVKLGSCE